MHVVELHAENLKRLVAVDITPDEHVVVVAGRNGQGKTTVLDAVALAIGGAAAAKGQPDLIRHGEKTAEVTVDLGDYLVTRTWTAAGSKLTVLNGTGVVQKSPQQLLDGFIGSLSFDPLAFANTPAKERRAQLLRLVELPFDLDVIDRARRDIFEQRTAHNRHVTTLEGAFKALPRPDATVYDGPTVDDATAALAAAADVRSANAKVRAAYDRAEDDLAEARRVLADAQRKVDDAVTALDAAETAAAALPPDPDTTELTATVRAAQAASEGVRARADWDRRRAELEAAKDESVALTRQLEEIDAGKLAGLQAARMPVEGLSFDDEDVTFNGVPFGQASGAERLRVSMAIGMAANPSLRVLLIRDGSLLDDDSMAMVRDLAVEHDFQIFLERVGIDDKHATVVIEEGAVRP